MADAMGVVGRDRLVARLEAAVTHRLTLVVADAGFGKTELLEQWREHRDVHAAHLVRPAQRDLAGIASSLVAAIGKRAPEEASRLALVTRPTGTEQGRSDALAGIVCAALAGLPDYHVILVLDDAHQMPEPTMGFVESLLRQAPPTLHLLVLSRLELPFGLDRLEDPVQRITGHDLGFDDEEMSELLLKIAGDDEHAEAVRALLGRWPAAVRLAAEQLARVPADRRTSQLLRLKTHGGRDLVTLAHEVISGESPKSRRLAQVVAPYDGFSPELAEALGCKGAAKTIADLEARGIVSRLGLSQVQYYAFPRLMREFVRTELPMGPDERPALVRAAGDWFEAHGQPEGALRCAIDQRDWEWVLRILRGHGRVLVDSGRGFRVAQGLGVLSPEHHDATIDEIEGAIYDNDGDHDRALACYERSAARGGPVSTYLANRTGFLHYFRGNLDEALRALQSAQPPEDSPDHALLQAWIATVLWAQGHSEKAWSVATAALALAEQTDDAKALAAAHTIMAMLSAHRGDRAGNTAHYDIALREAERSGDVLQVVRIRNNRGSGLLDEARLEAALAELEVAIELAQASGLRFYLSLSLATRGELRFHQGHYDAAVADLEQARDLDRAAGNSSSSVRIFLGHVYRHRGYANAARLAYEEVLAVGRSTGDTTLIVPALCGLAQLLAEANPALASQMSEEALSYDSGVSRVSVLCTAGWVAHAQGRLEQAAELAEVARAEAALRRDRLGEAEALQLKVVSDPVLQPVDPRLERAARILEDIGAPVWLARVRLEQARRRPVAEALAMIHEVEQLAAVRGARNLADKAGALARALDTTDRFPQVEVVTLGGFRVRRQGTPLSLSDWPDESASDLLKRLTSVGSGPWTRPSLQRSLWPGTPAAQGEAQLAEAIAHLRTTLDPEQELSPEQFVVERGDTVSLQGVEVDVHAFLSESQAGLDGLGEELLRRAEARYSGDYLEEHPGEPWALVLREEARARYLDVARALARIAARAGDADAASRYSRRILQRDPYDEGAHLALIAALSQSGRTVEARACYTTYVTRLDELGLEAIPWSLVLDSVTV